ncbi:MAG: HdeD family acid-resistance protein [Segniliparus sp.]|uniref:HdeD family acid-resistance protein n=1 Tax=Segniliparus sp. TaxID=2804064 RepID=UPI003F2BA96F
MNATPLPAGSGFLAEIGRVLRYWPAVLISGIVTVVAGILAIVFTPVTAVVIGLLFGLSILFQGVLSAAAAFGAKPGTPGRAWLGVWAALSIVIGLFAVLYPGSGALALAYLLIVWFLINAVNNIVRAASDKDHRVWFAVLGALELVIAFWLMVDILTAVDTVVLLFGFGLLLRGVGEIALSFRLRHVGNVLGGK